jgi:hypothetical protein
MWGLVESILKRGDGGRLRECRASTVGGKDDDEERRRGLYLVKFIANDDLHEFRWHVVLKFL